MLLTSRNIRCFAALLRWAPDHLPPRSRRPGKGSGDAVRSWSGDNLADERLGPPPAEIVLRDEPGDRGRDLLAALRRGLDWIGVIRIGVADQAKIEHGQPRLERRPQDGVVEQRQRRDREPLHARIRETW